MASKLCLGWPMANISMPCYCPREWPLHKIEVNCRLIETFVQTPLFPTTRAASSALAQFSNMGPWTWKWNSCDGNDRPILRPIKQFKFSFSPLLRALQKILCMYWTKKGKLQPKRLVKIYITCIKSSSFVKTTLANFMIRVLLLDLEIWKENS